MAVLRFADRHSVLQKSGSVLQAIWERLRELHFRLPPGSAARGLVEAENAKRGQKFVLKRMFSEGGFGLAIISFPSLLLEVRKDFACSAPIIRVGAPLSRACNILPFVISYTKCRNVGAAIQPLVCVSHYMYVVKKFGQ